MSKPVVKSNDEIVVTLEWLQKVVKMVDLRSYSCGGIFTCVDAEEAINRLTADLLCQDVEELKKALN